MNTIRRVCHSLAGLPRRASLLAASAAAAPAVLAAPPPRPPGWNKHPPLPAHTHTVLTGGMPGWQITLLAAAAALLVAAIGVTIYRMRPARQGAAATTA
jgi:hypothetical protein